MGWSCDTRVKKIGIMKLNLKINQIHVANLSDNEMSSISGGGEARSDRLTGTCAYSREHGTTGYWQQGATGCSVWIPTGCMSVECPTFK